MTYEIDQTAKIRKFDISGNSQQSWLCTIYVADEIFLTGTAAEVTPIREVDYRTIGEGKRGPITEELQAMFFDIVTGKDARYDHWRAFL